MGLTRHNPSSLGCCDVIAHSLKTFGHTTVTQVAAASPYPFWCLTLHNSAKVSVLGEAASKGD